MFPSEPPLAIAAEWTPACAEPDESGLPLRATRFLYSGFSRSVQVRGTVETTARLTPNETTP
jgi:hypothetical protein